MDLVGEIKASAAGAAYSSAASPNIR